MQPSTMFDLQDALTFVDANCCRDDWVKILMGIKSEFGEAAIDIADAWSQTGESYKPSDFSSTWRSIKASGKTSIATVFKQAIQNGYVKHKEHTPEELKQAKAEFEKRAIAKKEELAAAEAETKKLQNVISHLASELWDNYTIHVKSNKYLATKKVSSFGVRAFTSNVIVVINDNATYRIINDGKEIKQFFELLPSEREDRNFTFLHIKRADLAIPLFDANKKLWQLQIINSTGTKLFLKNGRKSGCFFIIGDPNKSKFLGVVEGYATGASIHMAVKHPVAITFDSGNLVKVAPILKELFPQHNIFICSDNDHKSKKNTGLIAGKKAAALIKAPLAIPNFEALAEGVEK